MCQKGEKKCAYPSLWFSISAAGVNEFEQAPALRLLSSLPHSAGLALALMNESHLSAVSLRGTFAWYGRAPLLLLLLGIVKSRTTELGA